MKKVVIWFLIILFSNQAFGLLTDGVTIPHKITTYDPARRARMVASGVDYYTDFIVDVEGVPLRVQTPGNTTGRRYIRITAYYGDPDNEIVYKYYPKDNAVEMKLGMYSLSYDKNSNKEMTYIVVDRVKDLLAAAYTEIGLDYDPETKQLVIDKSKYLAKADPQLNIKVENHGNKTSLIVSKAGQSATVSYNFDTQTVEKPNSLVFAGGYEWDVAADGVLTAVNPPPPVAAAGISASSIDWWGEIGDIVSLPVNLIESTYNVSRDYITLKSLANVKTQPQSRLPEPEIIDVSWLDRANGIVQITGKGGGHDTNIDIYITNNGQTKKISSGVSGTSDHWVAVNNLEPLSEGENKINAIVSGSGNREVESGDVTVYKGVGGQPDLILLSPRDRQVEASEYISSDPSNKTQIIVRAKGKLIGADNLAIAGNNIFVGAGGNFGQDINIFINEGTNSTPIEVPGNYGYLLEKRLIGAFKFVNSYKTKAFQVQGADFLFNGAAGKEPLFNLFPIPFDPNHTGIYTGRGNVTEAIFNEIVERPLVTTGDWLNEGFAAATQVPKIVSESDRDDVVSLVLHYQKSISPKYTYDFPINIGEHKARVYSLAGHYDGPANNKFYCSELAFWSWEQIAKSKAFDFGIIRKDTMFPEIGVDDPSLCSVLPAFLYRQSMGVKLLDK